MSESLDLIYLKLTEKYYTAKHVKKNRCRKKSQVNQHICTNKHKSAVIKQINVYLQ